MNSPAETKAQKAVLYNRLAALCKGPSAKLDAETCAQLKADHAADLVTEQWAREAIKNPAKPADYDQLVNMLIKVGAASQTGGMSSLFLK